MTQETPSPQTRAGQEQLRERGLRPLPRPDELTLRYWDAATRRELRLQQCRQCRRYQHPPRPQCGGCDSSDIDWATVSGRGTIFSFVVDYRLMVPGFDAPYVVAQVVPIETSSDTVRVTTNVVNCAIDEVHIDMPVQVTFEEVAPGVVLPQFEPVGSSVNEAP